MPAVLFLLAYITVIVACVGGYVMNIIDLIATLGGEITALFVARIAGILIPILGIVLGYVA